MNAMPSDVFPFRLHWDSQDLADAVPLRLFEIVDFATGDIEVASANAASLQRRARHLRSYLPKATMTALFRVGG